MISKPTKEFVRAASTRANALTRASAAFAQASAAVTFVSGALVFAYAPAAVAQLRSFPEKTKIGTLQMGNFPEAQINGKRILFSAGGRILNENNMSVIPMSIAGAVRIRYRLDGTGQVMTAWILSAQEAEVAKQDAAKQRDDE